MLINTKNIKKFFILNIYLSEIKKLIKYLATIYFSLNSIFYKILQNN